MQQAANKIKRDRNTKTATMCNGFLTDTHRHKVHAAGCTVYAQNPYGIRPVRCIQNQFETILLYVSGELQPSWPRSGRSQTHTAESSKFKSFLNAATVWRQILRSLTVCHLVCCVCISTCIGHRWLTVAQKCEQTDIMRSTVNAATQ